MGQLLDRHARQALVDLRQHLLQPTDRNGCCFLGSLSPQRSAWLQAVKPPQHLRRMDGRWQRWNSSLYITEIQAPRVRTETKLRLDEIRGFACVLLVLYHAVGASEQSGVHLPESSLWHLAMNSLSLVRMPLFTIVSGYVYALYPAYIGHLHAFFIKKARRILIPLIFGTVVMWTLRDAGGSITLMHALLYSYAHFWYLDALLLIFVICGLNDVMGGQIPGRVALTLIVELIVPVSPLLGLTGFRYLLPFFVFGTVLPGREHHFTTLNPIAVPALLGLVLVNTVCPISTPFMYLAGALSFTVCSNIPRNAFLARLGRNSYPIYLWHVLGMGIPRSVMLWLKCDGSVVLLVTMRLAAGLGLPMYMWHVLGSTPAAWLLFGRRECPE